jgi:hypothetical protein
MQDLAEWAGEIEEVITDEVVEWFDQTLARLQDRPKDHAAVIAEFFES